MIPSSLSLRLRSQLHLLSSPHTETKGLYTRLLLLYRRRLGAGFGAVQIAAKRDLRRLPAGRIVTYTRCRHCGRTGISLLTASTREHPSPRLVDKLRALLPSNPPGTHSNTAYSLRSACSRLVKVVRFRLHAAFDKLYTQPLARSATGFEFRPSELMSVAGEKVYNVSFTSEGVGNERKSYGIAVKLLVSRLETALRRRVRPIYEANDELFQ